MAKALMIEKVMHILPRAFLDELARDAGIERPWAFTRPQLEVTLLARADDDMREEIVAHVRERIIPEVERPKPLPPGPLARRVGDKS